jgi:hypothetical protein
MFRNKRRFIGLKEGVANKLYSLVNYLLDNIR